MGVGPLNLHSVKKTEAGKGRVTGSPFLTHCTWALSMTTDSIV